MNIAAGLSLLQEAYALFEELKADGSLAKLEAAFEVIKEHEANPKVQALLQKLSAFKL